MPAIYMAIAFWHIRAPTIIDKGKQPCHVNVLRHAQNSPSEDTMFSSFPIFALYFNLVLYLRVKFKIRILRLKDRISNM